MAGFLLGCFSIGGPYAELSCNELSHYYMLNCVSKTQMLQRMIKFVDFELTRIVEMHPLTHQSGTKPNLVARILTTKIGNHLWIGYPNW